MAETRRIYKTSNYRSFKNLQGNRHDIEQRAKKLMPSLERVGQLLPIAVNERMEVLDGQARLMALERLQMPVDYIVKPGAGIEECVEMNVHAKKWTTKNFIDSYAERGDVSYKYLRSLIVEFPQICMRNIIHAATGTNDFMSRKIADGEIEIDFDAYERARKILQYVTECKVVDGAGGRKEIYYTDLIWLYQFPGVDNGKLKERLHRYAYMLEPAATQEQTIRCLERIYNYRNTEKVYFTADYKADNDARMRQWGRKR